MKTILGVLLVLVGGFVSGTAPGASDIRLGTDSRATIIVDGQPAYPEGIAYDTVNDRFLVGSARLGHLFSVSRTGELRQFSSDDRIATSLGVKVDAARNRVVAAVTDYGVGERSNPERRNNLAAVAVLDLATGATLQFYDLTSLVPGSAHLANDVAVDGTGNIYVTDSLAAAIYRIDAGGRASVFVRSDQFRGEGFNLNGVDVHPDGYLLVVKKADGRLFRVPLTDPDGFNEVRLSEPITAADGILLVDGDLLVVRNRSASFAANETVLLRSDDGWRSAQIAVRLAQADDYPTTLTRRGEQIMTVAGSLHTLGNRLREQRGALVGRFEIRSVATVGPAP